MVRQRLEKDGTAALKGVEPVAPSSWVLSPHTVWILAFFVWWAFLVGHLLNNFKGLLPH
jgi:hypothetical protein